MLLKIWKTNFEKNFFSKNKKKYFFFEKQKKIFGKKNFEKVLENVQKRYFFKNFKQTCKIFGIFFFIIFWKKKTNRKMNTETRSYL